MTKDAISIVSLSVNFKHIPSSMPENLKQFNCHGSWQLKPFESTEEDVSGKAALTIQACAT